jgi:hypothetical protein
VKVRDFPLAGVPRIDFTGVLSTKQAGFISRNRACDGPNVAPGKTLSI